MLHENNENLMRFINLDKELSSIYQKQSKKFEISETTILITFPMAIGIVATNKMAAYLNGHGSENAGFALTQLSGLQIFLTSMLVGYVLLNFLRMLLGKGKRP